MNQESILTGIKPTGKVHIGNYFGAIKPMIELINKSNCHSFAFIADYHALTTVETAEDLTKSTYEVASTWLACGLNPEKVFFYRQSDVPEIFELFTILTNITPKGLMNRAHAYKAIVDENLSKKEDADANINMGLYNYPILMAADILLFSTAKVPVGLDQKQHIEIARDIAGFFNNKYGNVLRVPEEVIEKSVATITGLDGRKMSKSYNNVIELFADVATLQKTISRIVTDSSGPEEPKGTDNAIYELYKLFASDEECKDFENKLSSGISWADAKRMLFEKANEIIAPMREKYDYYINNPKIVDEILKSGADKAREIAKENIKRVKEAIGVL